MKQIRLGYCAPIAALLAAIIASEHAIAEDKAASEQQVAIDNFSFTPAMITVAVGTKVTWVNHDDVPHTVTSATKPRELNSGAMDTDAKYSHVFDRPGTYAYFCTVHPHMTGQIIVKAN